MSALSVFIQNSIVRGKGYGYDAYLEVIICGFSIQGRVDIIPRGHSFLIPLFLVEAQTMAKTKGVRVIKELILPLDFFLETGPLIIR